MIYRTRILALLLTSILLGHVIDHRVRAATHFAAASGGSAQPADDANRARYKDLLDKLDRGNQRVVRLRVDVARDRIWVLSLDRVHVYDAKSRSLIREVTLPDWSVADFICPPDMALDHAGNALVSNNVQPRLLQIDANGFHTTEHQLKLVSPKRWDIGFGALAVGSDGAIFGVSALAGTLWRIDLTQGIAEEIVFPESAPRGCALMNPA